MLPAWGTTCLVFHYSALQVSELYTSYACAHPTPQAALQCIMYVFTYGKSTASILQAWSVFSLGDLIVCSVMSL